ncbi:MAG: hydroxymethylpyrimidine/phosphomethylpyrimidine kinase [Gammaproteobacteria bacterium]|nr:hydroxymethylpyrimidine/phosphomethylpyrimidine kinase [Gammaproteobacteria bacterium]
MHADIPPPVVLIIAGHDPSGGAGMVADIQTVSALGGHPAPVISAITVQDTVNVRQVETVSPQLIASQARAVLADMPVAAIKLGLVVTADAAQAIVQILKAHAEIPVVLDPVLAAGGGAQLADETMINAYLESLVPLATVITPNTAESRRLAPHASDTQSRAAALLARGCRHVLITGADEHTSDVHNSFFSQEGTQQQFSWPRLPGNYHGSGCTLAAAIATLIALGNAPLAAVELAQRYTWETLKHGWPLGKGQRVPNRQIKS